MSTSTPKDVICITEFLRSQGITEYDPAIVSQLLEFCYRQTSEILTDADDYRETMNKQHVSKKHIDSAIEAKEQLLHYSYYSEAQMNEQAALINSLPIPEVPGRDGILLPTTDKLISENYNINFTKKHKY